MQMKTAASGAICIKRSLGENSLCPPNSIGGGGWYALKEIRVKSQFVRIEVSANVIQKLWKLGEKTVEIFGKQGTSKYLHLEECALYSYDQLVALHDVGAVLLLALLTLGVISK